MKRVVSIIISLAFLTACTGGDHTPPTEITTEPVIVETTETPATPTVEATKSPQDIADSLGLNDAEGYADRTYAVKDNLLIDNFNSAPKAVMDEDGSWRKLDYSIATDAEIMYGAMIKPEYAYICHDMVKWPDGRRAFKLQMVYLGDVSWEQEQYQGEQVSVPYLMMGIRDGEGRVRVFKYGVDAVREGSDHPFSYRVVDSDWQIVNEVDTPSINVAIKGLTPGDAFFELVEDPGETFKIGQTDESYMISRTMFVQNKAKMMTTGEWERMAQGSWPNGQAEYVYHLFNPVSRMQSPITSWE